MTPDLQKVLDQLAKTGDLPRVLTPGQRVALERSSARYAEFSSGLKQKEAMDGIFKSIQSIANPQLVTREGVERAVAAGFNPASARQAIGQILAAYAPEQIGTTLNLDFMLHVATEVMQGSGRFIIQNADPVRLDEFPALEFLRMFDRDVPRGFRKVKGVIVPAPDEDWPTRWGAAAAAAGDDDWLDWDDASDSGWALKSSGIWQALGDGAGGYDDTLGNPFDIIAFNTGYRQRERSRAVAEEMGLMDKGQEVKPNKAVFDLAGLFSMEAA